MGLSEKKIILTEVLGYSIVGGISFATAISLLYAIAPFVELNIINQLTISSSTVVKALLPYGSIIVLLIVGIGLDLKQFMKSKDNEKKTLGDNHSEIMSKNTSFFMKHILLSIDKYPKIALLIVFTFTLVLSGLSLYRILEQEQTAFVETNYTRTIDVIKEGYSPKEINGLLTLEEEMDWLTWSDVSPIDSFSGIEKVREHIVDDDLYFLLEGTQLTQSIEQSLNNQNNGSLRITDQNQKVLSPHIEWVKIEDYKELVGRLLPEKNKINELEAIFVSSSLDQEDSQYIQEDFVLSRTTNVNGKYENEEWVVPIEAAINHDELKEESSLLEMYDTLFIFPLTDTVKEELANRISGVSIILDPMILDTEYSALREYVVEIMSGKSGFIFRDSLGSQQEVQLFRQIFQTFSVTTLIIMLLLTTGIVFAIQYSKFLDEKEKYGVYLIQGLTRNKIKWFIISEVFIMFLLALIFSFLFILFIFLVNPTSGSFREYLKHLIISIGYLFGIICAVFLLIRSKINQFSIKQFL